MSLIVHCGGRRVSLEELRQVKAPEPTATWFPVSHGDVADRVKITLLEAGFAIRKEQYALSRHDQRFFGTLELDAPLASGVSLLVGMRSSIDKSIPFGFCAGHSVFVCENMAFRADLLVFRKHTRYGQLRFSEAIAQAVVNLAQFREVEAARIKAMKEREVSAVRADSLILNAFDKGIISAPQLPAVLHQWRRPDFEEFAPRTYWSLFNAFTWVLHDRAKSNPTVFVAVTMRLNHHLDPTVGEGLVIDSTATEVVHGSPA